MTCLAVGVPMHVRAHVHKSQRCDVDLNESEVYSPWFYAADHGGLGHRCSFFGSPMMVCYVMLPLIGMKLGDDTPVTPTSRI